MNLSHKLPKSTKAKQAKQYRQETRDILRPYLAMKDSMTQSLKKINEMQRALTEIAQVTEANLHTIDVLLNEKLSERAYKLLQETIKN